MVLAAMLGIPAAAGAVTSPSEYPVVTVTVTGLGDYVLSTDEIASLVATSTLLPSGIAPADMSVEQRAAFVSVGKSVAAHFYVAPQPGRYIYNGRVKRMTITGGKVGTVVSHGAIADQLLAAFDTYEGSGAIKVEVAPTTAPPTALGKAIVVDKSQRKLYLYDKGRIVLTYRCTIGSSKFQTPSGYFVIGNMRMNPSWGNPGSGWASDMPKYIEPGARNPLGVRAMNLNRNGRDTGLRIHGTTKTSEIGRAASHGCVRLTNTNVKKLFVKVKSGTPVIIQP